MIEKILCYAMLLNNELVKRDKYEEYLNTAFLEDSNNELLFKLQFLTSDLRATIRLIIEECYNIEIDKDTFAKLLLQELKETYYMKSLSIEEFANRAYSLWVELPYSISCKEPIYILSYANDPLSWGDVEQACKIYEKLFDYYSDLLLLE